MEKPILFTFRYAHFTFLYPYVQTVDPERNVDRIDTLLGEARDKIILDGAMGNDVVKRLEKQVRDAITTYTQKPELIIYDPRGFEPPNYQVVKNLNELEKLLIPKDLKKKNVRKS